MWNAHKFPFKPVHCERFIFLFDFHIIRVLFIKRILSHVCLECFCSSFCYCFCFYFNGGGGGVGVFCGSAIQNTTLMWVEKPAAAAVAAGAHTTICIGSRNHIYAHKIKKCSYIVSLLCTTFSSISTKRNKHSNSAPFLAHCEVRGVCAGVKARYWALFLRFYKWRLILGYFFTISTVFFLFSFTFSECGSVWIVFVAFEWASLVQKWNSLHETKRKNSMEWKTKEQ